MLLKLHKVGTGSQDDPNRVDVPTWTLVNQIENGSVWVVRVPDDELAERFRRQSYDLRSVDRAILDDLAAYFDERYRERAGEFLVDARNRRL